MAQLYLLVEYVFHQQKCKDVGGSDIPPASAMRPPVQCAACAAACASRKRDHRLPTLVNWGLEQAVGEMGAFLDRKTVGKGGSRSNSTQILFSLL